MDTNHQPHPAASLFPMLVDSELADLASDIKKNGLREPIALLDGMILDGRNRYMACKMASVEPMVEEVEVEYPTQYVISKNLHRRHLTSAQRAAIAVEMLPMLKEEAKKRQGWRGVPTFRPSGRNVGESREFAAKIMQVGATSVARAAAVKKADPEAFEKIKNGELETNTALRLVNPTPSNPAKRGKGDLFEISTERSKERAGAHKRRMVGSISSMIGACTTLAALDYGMVRAACEQEEIDMWIKESLEIVKSLREFAKQLEGK